MKGIVAALMLVAPIAALGGACGGDDDGGTLTDAMIAGGSGEPTNLTGITLFHNQVRAAVDTSGVAGGPLPMMQWDPDLAAHALTYTAMCKDTDAPVGLVDHSTLAYRTNAVGYAQIGENVFGAGGTATAKQAVDAWASEKTSFTYPSGCSGSCGHYTQVVSRASVNLGCANVTCPGFAYGGTILCMYGPAGNSAGAPY